MLSTDINHEEVMLSTEINQSQRNNQQVVFDN